MTRRTVGLIGVTTGLAALEAVILQAISFQSALPLAPQISAPAPLAVFHDLRWGWTFSRSPASVTWMLAALFAFRTTADALIIRLAWPDGRPVPGMGTLLRRSALFTVLAVVAMSPWATIAFVAGATGLSQLLLGAILGSGLVAILLPPGVITGDWWRRFLPLRSMGWVLLAWLGSTVAALAVTYSPPWVTVLAAMGGGLLNGWIWHRLVAAVVESPAPRWTIPGVPVIGVAVSTGLLVLGGYVFSGTIDIWGGSSSAASQAAASAGGTSGDGRPVIYVGGFDSSYAGGPIHLLPAGFREVNFSYRGLGKAGRPLPYGPGDTHQSLAVSAQRLRIQVQSFHRSTGRPVAIVAQSEGTTVAETYLASTIHPPVDAYVALSPLLRAGRVYYPPAGSMGPGYLAGWETRGIMSLFRLQSGRTDLRADMPFLRSLVDDAPLYRTVAMCPVPGVRSILLLPLEGATMVYRGPMTRIDWATFPGWHASLLSDTHTQRVVATALEGRPERSTGWAASFLLIRGAAGAWQSPALPFAARPAWDAGTGSDPAFGRSSCPPPATARAGSR